MSHNDSVPRAPKPSTWNDDFRLELFKRADDDWGWRIVSVKNNQNLNPEGYRRNKQRLIKLLNRLFPEATIHEVDG